MGSPSPSARFLRPVAVRSRELPYKSYHWRVGGRVIHIFQNHRTTGSAASLSPHPISPRWLNSGETAFNVLTRPPANLSPGTDSFTGDAAGAKANAQSSRHLRPNDYPPGGHIHPIESQIFLSHSQFLSPFFFLFFLFIILHYIHTYRCLTTLYVYVQYLKDIYTLHFYLRWVRLSWEHEGNMLGTMEKLKQRPGLMAGWVIWGHSDKVTHQSFIFIFLGKGYRSTPTHQNVSFWPCLPRQGYCA